MPLESFEDFVQAVREVVLILEQNQKEDPLAFANSPEAQLLKDLKSTLARFDQSQKK